MLFLRTISFGILAVMHASATHQDLVANTQVITHDPNDLPAFDPVTELKKLWDNPPENGIRRCDKKQYKDMKREYGDPFYIVAVILDGCEPVGKGAAALNYDSIMSCRAQLRKSSKILFTKSDPTKPFQQTAKHAIETVLETIVNDKNYLKYKNDPQKWVYDMLVPKLRPQLFSHLGKVHSVTPVIGATATHRNLVGNTQAATPDPNDLPVFDPVAELKKLWDNPPEKGIRLCHHRQYDHMKWKYGEPFYIVAVILDGCEPFGRSVDNPTYYSISHLRSWLAKSSEILFTKSDPTNQFQQKAKHAIETVLETIINDQKYLKYKNDPRKWVHDMLVPKLRPQLFSRPGKIQSATPVIGATATHPIPVGDTQVTTQDLIVPPVSKNVPELEQLLKALQDCKIPDNNIVPVSNGVSKFEELLETLPPAGIGLCEQTDYLDIKANYGDPFLIVAVMLKGCIPNIYRGKEGEDAYRRIKRRRSLLRKSSEILFKKSDPINPFQLEAKHNIETVLKIISNDPQYLIYRNDPEKWVYHSLVPILYPFNGSNKEKNVKRKSSNSSVGPPKKQQKIDHVKPHDINSALSGYTGSSYPEGSHSGQQSITTENGRVGASNTAVDIVYESDDDSSTDVSTDEEDNTYKSRRHKSKPYQLEI